MPATKPSIVGQKFGMLVCTAKGDIRFAKAGKKRDRMWLFTCDCGKDTELSRWKVEKTIPQQSCGCLNSLENRKKQHHRGKKPIDALNQRFGELTVIEQTDLREVNATVWRCLCDCGKVVLMSIRRLNKGFRLNCGDKKHMPGRKKYPPTPKVLPQECLEIITKYLHLVRQDWKTHCIDNAIEDERMVRLERAAYIISWRKDRGESISDQYINLYIKKYLFFAKLGYYSRLWRQQRSVRRYTVDDSPDNKIRYPMTKTIGVSPEGNLQVKNDSPKIRKSRRVLFR
jgi:hypothetical protein